MWRSAITALIVLSCGCATVRTPGEACDSYVSDEVAQVFRQYERYRDVGFREGLVGTARNSLERARQSLWGEPSLTAVPVCLQRHRRSAAWNELAADLEAAEALVYELEEARGVRFIEFASGKPQWVDSTTGKPIPSEFADAI